MAQGRFQTIPATTSLDDLAKHNDNWTLADSELTRIENKEDAAIITEAQKRAAEDSSLQTQITAEQQARISADAAHAASTTAHSADHITYTGAVAGATNVKDAADKLNGRIDVLVVNGDSSPAAADAAPGLDGTPHATLKDRLDYMEAKQLAAAIQSAVLANGWNYLLTNDASPLAVTVQGKTLANILGKDGGCESVTQFTTSGTVATSTTQVKQGSNSLKVTSAGSVSQAYKDYTYSLDTTKQYVLAGWVYVESWTSGTMALYVCDVGTGNSRYFASATTTTGSWQFIYVKIPTANTLVGTGFRLIIGTGSASPTFVAYFDAIRLYEIDLTTYNAIGSTYTASTSPAIDDILPYVDSVKHLQGVAINKPGANLLPDFTQWTLSANATVTGPYSLSLNATGSYQASSVTVSCLPSTQYTISRGDSSGNIYIGTYDSLGNFTSIITVTGSSYTFTTNSVAKQIQIKWDNGGTTGTFTFTNPMLNLGSSALAFQQRNDDFIYGVTDAVGNSLKLAGSPVSGVYDSLYYRDGAWRRENRFVRDFSLDGSLAWGFSNDYTGYKRVYISLSGAAPSKKAVVSKFDGRLLASSDSTDFSTTQADGVFINSTPNLVLSANDTDTGFDNAYLPTTSEIQSYFYGWKVNSYTTGTTITNEATPQVAASGTYTFANAGKYKSVSVQKSTDNVTFTAATEGTDYTVNFSGTAVLTNNTAAALYYKITYTYGVAPNSWASVVDGSAPSTNTLAYVSVTKATGYTPYSLTYQLATTTEEVVQVEGSIDTNPGGNQVEVAEGYIVREVANPVLYATDGYYRINDSYGVGGTSTFLKYRTSVILKIYRNGIEDKKWTISTSGPTINGKQGAYIKSTDYDPSAVYTVTYKIMDNDRGSYTANTLSVTGNYNSTEKDILDNLNKQMADTQTNVSVLQEISARKTQGQWIAPTMQNAWVNYGGTDAAAGYMKDDFGWVSVKGRIKSGTIGSTSFTLPSGYRPKETQRFAVSSNGAFGEVLVNTDGTIVPTVGSNLSFNVQIRFRAEQ